MSGTARLQVLRTIDKHDKIGTAGVVVLLQKPSQEFGAGLDPVQAALVGMFLNIEGPDRIDELGRLLAHTSTVRARVEVMALLEETSLQSGATALDHILAMPTNEDDSWSNGGRPANIAIVFDDIGKAILRQSKDARHVR